MPQIPVGLAEALLVTREGRLRLAAGYWHFVLAIWVVIYLAVCVL